MPTAGMMPQPGGVSDRYEERTEPFSLCKVGNVNSLVDIQMTEQTRTKSVSVRSQASQAFKTSVGRPMMG